MNRFIISLLIASALLSCSRIEPAQSILIDSNWKFSKENDTTYYKATVPGVIHTDLLENNRIEDPFLETNELKLQWIENENWTYKTNFTLTNKELNQEQIEIEFEGLDTYATVFLNGTKIIEASNMFRTWKADIKKFLNEGENILEVNFVSPINYNREKVESYPYKLPSGNETVDVKVSAFTRKAAYQFGWDWGPRFVTSGIWKNVKINMWNTVRIDDIFVQTDSINNSKAFISVQVDIEGSKTNEVNLELKLKKENGEELIKLIPLVIKKGNQTIQQKLEIENPNLWWPNGMGSPNLYELTVELKHDNQLFDIKRQNFGIRTIELIQEEDKIGTSFYFKVNGKPIFMKGANYIPQDVFLPRVTNRSYQKIIEKVVKSNMNMLRVWGGGIYEKDIFYELCDKNGILVWQDFMFAGSLYPSDTEFLENIKQEVIDNVTRLRKHPSIALWCGNNEIEVAWKNWGWQQQFGYTKKDSLEIWNSYKKIFQDLIPNTLKELDSKATYVHTSPLSNWGNSENFNHNSMHYWGVWHGKEPFKNFKKNVGRFMVEYGFQSFPSMKTIQTFASDSSLSLDSKTMVNRQKSYIGNGLISKHINSWFQTPDSFQDFVIKSQKTQTIALQTAIQSHRQQSPHCMGTLFWQLNDCWPGPSWSIIDYYGREKDAFNTVKENFKSVIAVLNNKKNEIEIISDLTIDFNGIIQIKLKQSPFSKIIFEKEFFIQSNSKLVIPFPKTKAPKTGAYALNIILKDGKNYTIYSDDVRIIN
ncbi:MAG: glycoside hydrolase family 2 protein [Lutibacter sp.]|uniref:glycoside hydrolase family 2 protein n=1 Tax=Lutibacter sp. TaxID=1925666 RepID=UPI00179D6F18|nr:sugar-binding domain-containing protein [Lutibacter sp.]MBT8318095.1 glycoside hydrolase family 2 protein [Lutibacter sp.]NNJ58955.1 glycoside hydrolase family 2 protein [Lutibacter sp.]